MARRYAIDDHEERLMRKYSNVPSRIDEGYTPVGQGMDYGGGGAYSTPDITDRSRPRGPGRSRPTDQSMGASAGKWDDRIGFENEVFKAIGGNPFTMNEASELQKFSESEEIKDLFNYTFQGQIDWIDRSLLTAREREAWNGQLKAARAKVSAETRKRRQDLKIEYDWQMGRFDKEAAKYKASQKEVEKRTAAKAKEEDVNLKAKEKATAASRKALGTDRYDSATGEFYDAKGNVRELNENDKAGYLANLRKAGDPKQMDMVEIATEDDGGFFGKSFVRKGNFVIPEIAIGNAKNIKEYIESLDQKHDPETAKAIKAEVGKKIQGLGISRDEWARAVQGEAGPKVESQGRPGTEAAPTPAPAGEAPMAPARPDKGFSLTREAGASELPGEMPAGEVEAPAEINTATDAVKTWASKAKETDVEKLKKAAKKYPKKGLYGEAEFTELYDLAANISSDMSDGGKKFTREEVMQEVARELDLTDKNGDKVAEKIQGKVEVSQGEKAEADEFHSAQGDKGAGKSAKEKAYAEDIKGEKKQADQSDEAKSAMSDWNKMVSAVNSKTKGGTGVTGKLSKAKWGNIRALLRKAEKSLKGGGKLSPAARRNIARALEGLGATNRKDIDKAIKSFEEQLRRKKPAAK